MKILKARNYRVSTQISDDYGLRLEKLQLLIRQDCGRRMKIAELLELGIEQLESAYDFDSVVKGDKKHNVETASKYR